jgi:cell volume regulation protein A
MFGMAFFAFGAPSLLGGSGFLAVYVAGVVLGNGPLPFRAGLLRVHDALAWFSQITMFLVLGLLVYPSRLPEVALVGVALALIAVFVARPLAVALCVWPFRYPLRETVYISYVGLRGAVPIILATYPILQGVPGAERLFDIVFFLVLVNAIIPGSTVPWVTRKLGMGRHEPPAPPAVLEIESRFPLQGELMSFYVDDELPVAGAALRDVPLPAGATVALLVRGRELVPPSGGTVLQPGDHVYIITDPANRGEIQLLFGTPENE